MKRKISVVIPFYQDDYLPQALASVLEQTRPADEIIVVNDGSVENLEPLGLAKTMAAVDNRIKVLELPVNQGIGAVRKFGLANATGDWIAFLSSDDKWKPNFLAEMELAIDRCIDVDVFYSDYDRIDGDNNFIGKHQEAHIDNMDDFRMHVWQRHNVNFSAAIFRAEALKKVDFDEDLRIGEDYLCLLKLARDYKFKHLVKSLAYYRIHGKQATNLYLEKISKNDDMIRDRAREYYELVGKNSSTTDK